MSCSRWEQNTEPGELVRVVASDVLTAAMKATLPNTAVGTSGPNRRTGFAQFAAATASWAGSTPAFIMALIIVVIWAAAGPLFNFSDAWQLGHQYRHVHHLVVDGVLDPEHAKP
jgi:hypothetical protein